MKRLLKDSDNLLFKLAFGSILVFAFLIRVVNLETIPRGLQSDEASFYINSAAILETGMDEDGRRFPLYLHSLIDGKPALYSYLQAVSFALFGMSTATSRLPSVLIGTGSIALFYLFLHKYTGKRWLALLGMLLFAISPWHIMNSRATQEVILSLFFILGNLIAFKHLIESKKITIKNLLLFSLTAGLAMYSYHAAKIVLMGFYFFNFCLAISRYKESQQIRRHLVIFGTTTLLFALTAGGAMVRFSAIGLISDDLPKALIHEMTTKSTGETPLLLLRSFYNKPVMYLQYFARNYLAHFDLNFFFTLGGATKRFAVPYHGLFYLIELAVIPLGIYQLVFKRSYRGLAILCGFLILLSPIPAAMTNEEIPSSIRSFTLIIPMIIFVTLGLQRLLELIKKSNKYLLFGAVAALIFGYTWSIGYFSQQFFVVMPKLNSTTRSRNYEIVAPVIAEYQADYERAVVTSDLREMYIYLWQVGLISIQEVQNKPLARYQAEYSIGKFNFNQERCLLPNYTESTLYVAPADCREERPKNLTVVEQTYFDDGETPGFVLLKN